MKSGGVVMRFGQRGGKSWTQPELLGGETPTSCSRGVPPIRQLCLELPYTYFPFSTDEFSAFSDSNTPIEREILQCTAKYNDTLRYLFLDRPTLNPNQKYAGERWSESRRQPSVFKEI